MSRRVAILVSSGAACLSLTCTSAVRAEEVEDKVRLAFSIGSYGTTDQQHSPSANRRTIFLPNGELEDIMFDPRNDSAAFSNFGIESQPSAEFSASYAFTRFWYIQGSVGYRTGSVGNVEVQAQFDGAPIPNVQPFAFAYTNLSAGTITQVPASVSVGVRFRPKASFNPYLYAGVGYSFNSFTPSDELNQLSSSLDQSTGGFALLTGSARGGESLSAATTTANLKGITVDVQSEPEWHFGGGLEYTVKSRWAIFLEGRYTVYSGTFGLTVNGSDQLGVSVPSDRALTTDPGVFGPFGAYQITRGGLLDGGSYVPKPGQPPDTNCAISTLNCQLTGPGDGINDPGFYYVHAGSVRYDGASFQIGFKYTF